MLSNLWEQISAWWEGEEYTGAITMKHSTGLKIFGVACALVAMPFVASAHQPRITVANTTSVVSPEISKAYYAQLDGEPQIYRIDSEKVFKLYVGLLVPNRVGQETGITAEIYKEGNEAQPLATLQGAGYNWTVFDEPFGHDSYLQGPEYRAEPPAGSYYIKVFGTTNREKYSLAIGEEEKFDIKETVNAIRLIPEIKKNFFNESPISFVLSPFGAGYILVLFVASWIGGFLYRLILRRVARGGTRSVARNIGKRDRFLRAAGGVALLGVAITTTWNPFLIFFAGFCFFEAIFSWCGLFAALGRNSCDIR